MSNGRPNKNPTKNKKKKKTNNANLNPEDTLLVSAVQAKESHIVAELLAQGANGNSLDTHGRPLIHRAVLNQDIETVKVLLANKENSDISYADPSILFRGKSALMVAADQGYADIVLILCQKNKDMINQYSESISRRYPLQMAIDKGHHEAAKVLLDHGADINVKNQDGCTPFYCSVQNNDNKMVEILLANKNLDLNTLDDNGRTQLHVAASRGDMNVIKMLVKNHSKINVKDNQGKTPFHLLASSIYGEIEEGIEIMKLFIDSGLELNPGMNTEPSPLYLAAQFDNNIMIDYILGENFISKLHLNKPDENNYTQLHLAVQKGHSNVIKILLDKRVGGLDNLNQKDNNGLTPIDYAVMAGHFNIFKSLYEAGRNAGLKIDDDTLLTHAINNNHIEIASYLLAQKKDEIDKSFSNVWEERDALYEKEVEFIDAIPSTLMPALKIDANRFFELIDKLHTDRAKALFFEKVFTFNSTEYNDVDFIINHLPKLISCFRTPDEFIYLLEKSASKDPIAKFEISKAIDDYHLDIKALTEYMFANANSEQGIALSSDAIDILLSSRRSFIGAINLLHLPEPRSSLIKQLSSRLDSVIQDRYDWFNFIAGCSNSQNASTMVELIDFIFAHNPSLANKFSADSIKNLITTTQREVDKHISSLKGEDINKPQNNYRVCFSAGLINKMFSSTTRQNVIIEKGYEKKNMGEKQARLRDIKLMRRQSTIIKPVIKNASKAETNAQKRLFQLVDTGRDYRNQNINFIAQGGWQQQRYGNPILLEKRNYQDLVKDVLGRLEGYNPETNFYRPFTSGNCFDQANIQLAYLASTPQTNTSLQGKMVLRAESPHSDHAYIIVTKLTQDEIEALPCNEFGRVDLLSIFNTDEDAVLVDPWRMALFHYPQDGLHYTSYPHNDTTLPEVSDPSGVSILATCQIGQPQTMKMYNGTPKLDAFKKPMVNDKNEALYQRIRYVSGEKNFISNVEDLKNDPRWMVHCEQIEHRPVRKEALRDFFEFKSIYGSQSLEAYQPVTQDINRINYNGKAPIHLAIEDNNIHAVEKLINAGADINLIDSQGYTPLGCAIELRNVEMVKRLINAGANVNTIYPDGESLISAAGLDGQLDILIELLNAANIQSDVSNLLYTAADNNWPKVLDILVERLIRNKEFFDVMGSGENSLLMEIKNDLGVNAATDILNLAYSHINNQHAEIDHQTTIKYLSDIIKMLAELKSTTEFSSALDYDPYTENSNEENIAHHVSSEPSSQPSLSSHSMFAHNNKPRVTEGRENEIEEKNDLSQDLNPGNNKI